MQSVNTTNDSIKSESLIEATTVDRNIRIQNVIESIEVLPTTSYEMSPSRNYTYSFFTI